jgi:hypothetical protein
MQFAIDSDAAVSFACRLYRNIALGERLVDSVGRARTDLDLAKDQWYRPVLYMRYREDGSEGDGRFFRAVGVPIPRRPVTPLPPPLPPRAHVSTINTALTTLAGLVGRDDAVRQQILPFRERFAQIHGQADLLGDYKDLHDQLHELKLKVFSPVRADPDGSAPVHVARQCAGARHRLDRRSQEGSPGSSGGGSDLRRVVRVVGAGHADADRRIGADADQYSARRRCPQPAAAAFVQGVASGTRRAARHQ